MTTDEKKLVVYKSNPLLDMKNEMGLYQQRMFNLYLAAINPLKEAETKKVTFTLSEFVRLLDITEVSPKKLHALARESVRMYVDLYAIDEVDGRKKADSKRMNYVNMWRRFRVDKDDNGEWFVELEAGEDVLPYMFEIKSLGYLNFPVIYALRMRSPIAEKLYEQCARYKDKKRFTITVDELKKRLGIAGKKSYQSYNRLKSSVLLRCIEEINTKTDIEVAIIEEERLRRRGSPVSTITFSVEKNKAFKQPKADQDIEQMHEKSMPIESTMTPVDATADRQLSLAAYELQQDYGLTAEEAETIIKDREKLGLSESRTREVIEYVKSMDSENPIGYIRSMLRKPDADLTKASGKKKNLFNEFMKSDYGDMDKLEEELLAASAKIHEHEAENVIDVEAAVVDVKEKDSKEKSSPIPEGLPPYYIVIGRPDVPERLAAYQALGIPGDKIRILTKEEHEKLSRAADFG